MASKHRPTFAMGKPAALKSLKREATVVPRGIKGEAPVRSKRDKERTMTTRALKCLGAPPVEGLVTSVCAGETTV